MCETLLTIDGAVDNPQQLTFAELSAFPESAQFADVSRLNPSRRGDGVTLDAILERSTVRPGTLLDSACKPRRLSRLRAA